MRASITNGSDDLQASHCKLLGNLWGRFDLYFDQPIGKNLYLGRQEASQAEFWIKEYLLDDTADVQRHTFQQLIDLNLKLGQGPDFRLVQLKDFATTNQACYLISHPLPGAKPLAHYLSAHGPLSSLQVQRVLQQCLETLRYLHTACSVAWPTGSERGLCHGNLSLDSLWIRTVEKSSHSDNFFVYVTDLALWEHIFWAKHPLAQCVQDLGSIHQDLYDLGHIGCSLLLGQPLNATTAQTLTTIEQQSPELLTFLHRLIGQTATPFRTTEEALQVLRDLPKLSRHRMTGVSLETPAQTIGTPAIDAPIQPTSKNSYLQRVKTAAGVAMGLMGMLWLGYRLTQQQQLWPLSTKAITASYLLEPQGTWQSVLATSPEDDNLITALLEQGHSLQPAKVSGLRPDQITRSDIFKQLLEKQADFALMDSGDDLPAGLSAEPIAYDAIVPFVAFANDNQARQATTFIGDSLSLEQLRQVFTGNIDTINGTQVQAYFPEVPYIKAYPSQMAAAQPPKIKFATRPSLFDRFYQQVLEGDTEALTAMEQVLAETRRDLRSHIQQTNGHGDYDIFTNVNRSFNQWNVLDNTSEPTIGIGFDRLSQVRQQCNVYPLAIEVDGRQLQLFQQEGQAISPRTDLCQNFIQPDITLIQQLAVEDLLAYKLVLVYPKNSETGAAVAELFRRQESQNHLQALGIIPVASLNP